MKSLAIVTDNGITTAVCHTSVIAKVFHNAGYFILNVNNWPTLTTAKAMNKTLAIANIKGVVRRSKGQLVFHYQDKIYQLGKDNIDHRFFLDKSC